MEKMVSLSGVKGVNGVKIVNNIIWISEVNFTFGVITSDVSDAL